MVQSRNGQEPQKLQALRKKFSPTKTSELQKHLREKSKSDFGGGAAAPEAAGPRLGRNKGSSVPAAQERQLGHNRPGSGIHVTIPSRLLQPARNLRQRYPDERLLADGYVDESLHDDELKGRSSQGEGLSARRSASTLGCGVGEAS